MVGGNWLIRGSHNGPKAHNHWDPQLLGLYPNPNRILQLIDIQFFKYLILCQTIIFFNIYFVFIFKKVNLFKKFVVILQHEKNIHTKKEQKNGTFFGMLYYINVGFFNIFRFLFIEIF